MVVDELLTREVTAEEVARAEAWLYEGRVRDGSTDAHEILKGFIDRTDRLLRLIGALRRTRHGISRTIAIGPPTSGTYTRSDGAPVVYGASEAP